MKKINLILKIVLLSMLIVFSNFHYVRANENSNEQIKDGIYKIVLATAPNQSLTVDGGKKNNGANVHIWQYVNAPQQQFRIKYVNGYYEIIPMNSGKRLDVVGWGNKANVDQWDYNGGNDNQKWIIYKNSRGNYNIISKRQNLYLDAFQSRTSNGTNIEVYEKSGGNGQEFKLEKIGTKSEKTIANGEYSIGSYTNKNIVVEASASNTENNGRLQVWQNYNVKAQRVNITYENNYYKIALCHSNKYLTAKQKKVNANTEVVQNNWENNESQKWVIRQNGNGSIGIVPISNWNLAINIKGKIQNGSVLELEKNTKSNNQKFSFKKIFNRYIEEGNYGWSGLKVKGNGNRRVIFKLL